MTRLRSATLALFAASVVFAVALPVLLISGNVRSLVTSTILYDYGWWRYDTSGRTGLPPDQLDSIAEQFRDYFTGADEFLDLRADREGGRQEELLSEREVLHMRDVKALVRRVFAAEWVAGVLAGIYVVAGFATLRGRFWPVLRRTLKYSAAGSLIAIAIIGVAALINFDAAFTLFHLIGFSNDLWQLNPYRDYLLLLFPEGFFFDATMAIAIMTALEFGVAVAGIGWFERKYRPAASRPAKSASV
ncbi:MAG: TIGR01906 family membrane protein [Chloroflexi bacterium]|nr:TIGR01906 family membrane protein [Chloroflexota bacterium]